MYATIIGSLRYATDYTKPDIACVVGLLCGFTSRSSLEHWNTIERVIRYLKKTQNLRFNYQSFPLYMKVIVMLIGTPSQMTQRL